MWHGAALVHLEKQWAEIRDCFQWEFGWIYFLKHTLGIILRHSALLRIS